MTLIRNWMSVSLTDVCNFVGGTQPPKSTFSSSPLERYIRLVQIQDFERDDRAVYVPDTKNLKKFTTNDIMIARYGASLGRILTGLNGAYNVALVKAVPDESRLCREFLYFLLVSEPFQEFLKNIGSRAAQAGFNRDDLSRFTFALPPLSEQKRIADILDKADAIRRKRQEAIRTAQEIPLSAYQHLFGDPIVNTHGWPTDELGNIADVVTGYAFKSSEYLSQGIKLCRGANVLPDQIDWSDVRYWRNDDSTIDEKMKLESGDVILAMDRPWISSGLKVAQMTENDLPAYLVQRVTRIRSKNHISNEFLYYTIRHPAFTTHCGGLKTETTVPHISSDDIKSFRVPIAPKQIHQSFEAVARRTQAVLEHLHQALADVNSLFNSIVQRAFRGDL